ncbi:MAG: ethanolamine utilization protein [Burkholderiales bacterium]|jgi:DNA polymerase III subunit epsilon|nr:ethanolamine utilization protein [Burkholderiales bacterium]
MFDQPAVFLDVETTGATANRDRITEIGLVEVADGKIVEEWSSLVNPGQRIPPEIEMLTGITNAMVADAPSFDALSAELHRRLEGKLLIAHNARFDYGFLRNEFARVGLRYLSRVLCTVKLSRRLYPQERRHNLDSLIERHGLACNQRHRALADARVLWDFAQHVRVELGADAVRTAVEQIVKTATLPPRLDPAEIDALPGAIGVYIFYGEGDTPLYVGKSLDIRSRVLAHFSGDHRVAKDMRIAQEVARIDWHETAGELGALLQEARWVKQVKPIHNHKLRPADEPWALWWDAMKTLPPKAINASTIEFAVAENLYGPFRSRARANRALREIGDANGLCARALGLEHGGTGPCFSYQVGKCRGACCGRETPIAHNLRLAQALQRLRLQPWPFGGAIGVREVDRVTQRAEVHLVDRWSYLGTVDSESDLHDALATRTERAFDLDTYQILSKWLKTRRHQIEVIDLAAAGQVARNLPVK